MPAPSPLRRRAVQRPGRGNSMTAREPVLVGADGTDSSATVVSWAAAEAQLRGAPIRVLHVSDDPDHDDAAADRVRSAVDLVAREAPGVQVCSEIARGHPASELVRRSTGAQLVVVGSTGRSPLRDALLGSVSSKVATHAHCPVVVVRDSGGGPVVVGLDNSRHSRAALRFAFEAAALRQTELVAVQVWREPEEIPVIPMTDDEIADQDAEARRELSEQLAGWSDQYPAVPVTQIGERGHPVVALTFLGRGAQLVVVGHRGRGGFTGLLLGSVAAGVLHHATCPVAVVRDR